MGQLPHFNTGDIRQSKCEACRSFSTSQDRVVETQTRGSKRLLRRHPDMERAVISCVERGLADPDWRGILYVMGWGTVADFRPLYIGKTGRLGRGTAINANLKTIRSNYSKFARWGDDRYRHIGGLSQALFDDDGSQPVPEKYRCWNETLFVERTLPQLRRETTLILIPWSERSVAPSGRTAVLQNAEDELIQLAATDFPDLLLNVKGDGQAAADGTSLVSLSTTGITRQRTLVSDATQLADAVSLIERCPVIGLDVETEIPSQRLCLVQVAIESETFLIDALRVSNLAPSSGIGTSRK